MVGKDSRKRLIAFSFLLLHWAGCCSPAAAGGQVPNHDFAELDEIVAIGPLQTDRRSERSLTLLSINLNRFFDDVDDGNREEVVSRKQFRKRVRVTAAAFAERFGLPDVIAVQEVENRNVLEQLAADIHRHRQVEYRAVLIEGHDPSGIDVGYLIRSDLDLRRSAALFGEMRLAFDDTPLFSRPPLYLEICRRQSCFALLNLHLRSMRGIDSESGGDRVARKRRQQAETIAAWIQRRQMRAARPWLLIVGDLNALTPPDRHVDVAGIIRGNPDNRHTRLPGRDLIDPDLIDQTRTIPVEKRYSFVYRGLPQQLDYLLINADAAVRLESIAFARIDRRWSDHAGLYARFSW